MNPVRTLANMALLASGLATAISGLAIQVGFHLGAASQTARLSVPTFGGLGKLQWALMHKVSISIFSMLLLQHVIIRRSWYLRLMRRGSRWGHPQLLWLTILMLLVALTGLGPWGLALLGISAHLRFLLIEVHDKLALPLVLLLLFHIAQRVSRFVSRVSLRGER